MYSINEGLFTYLFDGKLAEIDHWYYITFLAFILISMTAAYLLGSINSAIIVSKVLYRDDIRKHGSGNAGMTNMLRTYGGKAALLTLLGDLLKTALAIVITAIFFGFNYVGLISTGDGFCYMAGLFAVIGHVFPVYYGFKGGKGVLATAVTALILAPIPFAILFALFAAIVASSRYVSLASVSAAVLLPIALRGYFAVVFPGAGTPGIMSLCAIIIAILIVWCHRENLKRISNRTENKISFGKKNKKKNDE